MLNEAELVQYLYDIKQILYVHWTTQVESLGMDFESSIATAVTDDQWNITIRC